MGIKQEDPMGIEQEDPIGIIKVLNKRMLQYIQRMKSIDFVNLGSRGSG